jgi:hypothetical protein
MNGSTYRLTYNEYYLDVYRDLYEVKYGEKPEDKEVAWFLLLDQEGAAAILAGLGFRPSSRTAHIRSASV